MHLCHAPGAIYQLFGSPCQLVTAGTVVSLIGSTGTFVGMRAMAETDIGRVAVGRLRELMHVPQVRGCEEGPLEWSCWGVQQRAWSEVSRDPARRPVWRVHLRTEALGGFKASGEQTQTLSSGGCPALASLVRNPDRPDTLELSLNLDVHAGNIDWVVRVLDVAARVQATETHIMSLSYEVPSTGLMPLASIDDWTHPLMRPGAFPVDDAAKTIDAPCWRDAAVAGYVELLRSLGAHAVQTTTGITATITGEPAQLEARSIIEVIEREHPALGPGLSVVVWTPVRDGLVGALQANERELSAADHPGLSLGGWWAAEGGLRRHVSFYPYALRRDGVVRQLLFAAVRRARQA